MSSGRRRSQEEVLKIQGFFFTSRHPVCLLSSHSNSAEAFFLSCIWDLCPLTDILRYWARVNQVLLPIERTLNSPRKRTRLCTFEQCNFTFQRWQLHFPNKEHPLLWSVCARAHVCAYTHEVYGCVHVYMCILTHVCTCGVQSLSSSSIIYPLHILRHAISVTLELTIWATLASQPREPPVSYSPGLGCRWVPPAMALMLVLGIYIHVSAASTLPTTSSLPLGSFSAPTTTAPASSQAVIIL